MSAFRLRLLGLLGATVAFLADQATKQWALAALWPPYEVVVEVLPVWNFRLGFNTGVTFGLFRDSAADKVWILVAAKLAVVAFLLVWMWRTRHRAEALALGLVAGGALGNILDRVRIGAVVDFVDWHHAGWHWPTFNMADVAIVCGAGLLLFQGARGSPRAGRAEG
ncbi:MAG: signal peptidase II [Acetobacteraceae bacterium]|nr:signal peptidase II [Acetobacteraceae bacterium]